MPRELIPDALLRALTRARPEEVIELLRGREEAERRAVAPAIRDALAHHRAWECATEQPAGGVGWEPVGHGTPPAYYEALALAALGTTGLSDVRRTPLWPSDEGAFAVLAERRPRWLADWAATASWRVGRMLTRAGLIAPQRDDARIEALIAETGVYGGLRPATLLREDPELLEHEVWRLFEVEGSEVNLSSADARDERGWNWALREAAADGRIDRARLLDATLEALTRDFGAYRNRWYTRLHTDLEPTLSERIGFADRYLAQLHSPHGETAAWALDRVAELDREQPLDSAALLAALPAVLTSTRKRTVKAALATLRRVAEREPAHADECARLAAEALVHEAADVQALALAFDPPAEAVERFRDVLAPTNRAAVGGAPAAPDAPDLDGLAARIEAVAPVAREALALDAALAAARDGTTLVLPEPAPDEPRLSQPLPSIDSLDELAASLLARLNPPESGDDEHEQERALDAIARLCGSRAPFDGPLKPVLARAWAETWPQAPVTFHDVIIAWARGTTRPRAEVASPFGARLAEVAERCAAGRAGPLLAAPTHRGGWIDPLVLVERAAQATLDPHSPDLTLALLRLAPERRAAALAAAAKLPGSGADALRCALGGPDVDGDAPAVIAARLTRLPALLDRPRPATELDGHGWYVRELWPDPPPGTAAWLPWRWLNDASDLAYVETRSPALDWPGCRDPAHVHGRTLGLHVDLTVVEALLDPSEPVTAAAAQLLAAALGAEIAAERMLGIDATIAAIDSGRLDAALLGGALRAEHEGLFVPARVARSLTPVAQVSVLHAETVREALDALLAGVTSPKGMLPLLTLLNELSEDAGAAVTQRRFLESITGASKTAKAAKALLARTGTSRHAAAAAALALDARIARAERWRAMESSSTA